MTCKICAQQTKQKFQAKILNKYDINYFYCDHCGFLQTEEPYWLDEAYSHSINLSDTGYMVRNLFYAKRLTILLPLLFDAKARFLDYAGGYGVFVRLMRDIGFDFYWADKFTENLFAKGFEVENDVRFDAVTTFESFEHFVDPIIEIESLLEKTDTIIFSTELLPEPLPQPEGWWYYGLDHGQHISFYSEKTFNHIAKRYGLNYYSLGSLHILTRKNIAKWKLLATRVSKFGLHKIVAKQLNSKTWDDYNKMTKLG